MRSQSTLVIAAALTIGVVAARVGAQAPPQTPPAGGPPATQGAPPAGGQRGATFPAQQRPPADPAVVERGKTLYGINCQSCHGSDLRGGDMGGPNLLRSQVVLGDNDGELIVPIIHGSRAANGMDPVNINAADAHAVAVYLHAVAATMQGQGGPPRGNPAPPNEAVLVGNVAAGQAYFAAKCSTCHSVTGDLAGISARFSTDARGLQTAWVAGSGGRGGGGRGGGTPTTVTVTMTNGQRVEGQLVRVDDFIVIVRLADGTQRSIGRTGAVPKVDIKDPGAAHRALLPTYTDKDMHDVTAYLASIK